MPADDVRRYGRTEHGSSRRPHPLVRLGGLRSDDLAGAVVVPVRLGVRDASGEWWAVETVEHVYWFGEDELVRRMEVREGSGSRAELRSVSRSSGG